MYGKVCLNVLYNEPRFLVFTQWNVLTIWNRHIWLSCRWDGRFLPNSQNYKTDVAILTSNDNPRPWPLVETRDTLTFAGYRKQFIAWLTSDCFRLPIETLAETQKYVYITFYCLILVFKTTLRTKWIADLKWVQSDVGTLQFLSTDIPTALALSSMIILSILSVSLLKLVFHLCYEWEDISGTKC